MHSDTDGVIGEGIPYEFRPFVRTPYNYDRESVSVMTALHCRDDSLAKQEYAEEVDINTIITRFGQGYKMPENLVPPTFGDFTGVTDFQSAMDAMIEARDTFMMVPADIRARFGNDPQAFVAFCSDEANRDELKRMGFLEPREAPVQASSGPGATAPASSPSPASAAPAQGVDQASP